MHDCTSAIINKVSETVSLILGSCIPEVVINESREDDDVFKTKDDEYRKAELKQLVGIFSSRAQDFIDCYVSVDDARFTDAQYKLDKLLRILMIKSLTLDLNIKMKNVNEVYSYTDLIKSGINSDVLEQENIMNLTTVEKSRFLLIEYFDDERIGMNRLIILERCGNSDPFIAVIRILKMYADTPRD